MNFPAGFNERMVCLGGSEAFAVRPTELAGYVVNGKGIDIVAVFAETLMDLLIHGIVLFAALIVVEIACVYDAQGLAAVGSHGSFRPSLARWISYIFTSLSQRLEAMTTAQAKP